MSRVVALGWLLVIPFAPAQAQHADHGTDEQAGHAAHGVDEQAGHAAHGADEHAGHAARGVDEHADHAAPAYPPDPPQAAPPPEALAGPLHAADTIFSTAEMAAARVRLSDDHGGLRTQGVLADRFEVRVADGDERYLWDVQGWHGGDLHKLWWKSEGDGTLADNADHAELQLLYSRAVTPFFDMQFGARRDLRPSPGRSHAVLGVQGLLPYVFEIDAAAFLSEDGDVTARFEAEYDLRLRQRWVLQPRIELNFSAQAVPELGIGSGLGTVEGGVRLRYELRRELAPYLGLGWERKVGSTADFARAEGDDARDRRLVIGLRAWF